MFLASACCVGVRNGVVAASTGVLDSLVTLDEVTEEEDEEDEEEEDVGEEEGEEDGVGDEGAGASILPDRGRDNER